MPAAGFGGSQKTKTDRNHGFFLKTQPKPTDLCQCEIVTTLSSNAVCSKVKGGVIALNGSPFHSYGASSAIWDHMVLPATRHR